MPCNQMRVVAVQLERSDTATMMAALTALAFAPQQIGDTIEFGRGEWINTKTGQSRLGALRDVNEIRRAYSREIVKRQAKKFGWTLKQQAGKQDQYQVIKR